MPKAKRKASPDTSPLHLVADELVHLRKHVRATVANYGRTLENELASVSEAVALASLDTDLAPARYRNARDMMTILRGLKIKPEKGRRRDLKKLETLIEDLQGLAESW